MVHSHFPGLSIAEVFARSKIPKIRYVFDIGRKWQCYIEMSESHIFKWRKDETQNALNKLWGIVLPCDNTIVQKCLHCIIRLGIKSILQKNQQPKCCDIFTASKHFGTNGALSSIAISLSSTHAVCTMSSLEMNWSLCMTNLCLWEITGIGWSAVTEKSIKTYFGCSSACLLTASEN